MKKLLLLAIAAAAAVYLSRQPDDIPREIAEPTVAHAPAAKTDRLANVYAGQQSGVQVAGGGVVTRILGDDIVGDRHQRFILTLDSGQTLLIAHNIDVAQRIESLREGDSVSFSGEYEWNDDGGVVHWTHHDPQGQHEAGWLRHRGRTYQ
ncbi:MAG: DUF3465 domain-containing protein [Steroidobacteraceae bacterium]